MHRRGPSMPGHGARNCHPLVRFTGPPGGVRVAGSRARTKVRQWFNTQELEQTMASGRAAVEKELHREGRTGANLTELAASLGFSRPEDLFVAVGREEIGPRQLQLAIRGKQAAPERPESAAIEPTRPPAPTPTGSVLIVGVDRLLTQLARCCKPVPPDPISGFVTRGRGISVHRRGCRSFARLAELHPERVVQAAWGDAARQGGAFPLDIAVRASERLGLLRDVTEVLAREQIRVSGLQSYVRQGSAVLFLTLEVKSLEQLNRSLPLIEAVQGVFSAKRR